MSWKKPAVVWEKSPWSEAVEVYVGAPSRFFINGTEIERSELRSRLLEQLGRRAEWTVYFEADPNTVFGDDAYGPGSALICPSWRLDSIC